MNNAIRHGEVILKPVAKLPAKTKIKTSTAVDTYRAADSDAGHHHVLNSKQMQVVTTEADTFVSLVVDGTIIHQKETDRHKDLPVTAGVYQILKKNEYDPFEKVIREVMD